MFPTVPQRGIRLGRWILLLLSLLPLAGVVLYIANYRLSVPYGDEWRIDAPIALAAVDGQFTVARLFTVDDGHRTVFTNAFISLISAEFRWSLKLETAVNFSVVVGYVVLLFLLVRQSKRDRPLWPVAILIFSVLTFSLSRETSWLSFRHSHYSFGAFFFLLTLWISGQWRASWRTFIALIVCATCASFSIANGLLVWPLMFVLIAARGFRRTQLALWVGLAVVVFIAYLSGSGIGLDVRPQVDPGSTAVSKASFIEVDNLPELVQNTTTALVWPLVNQHENRTANVVITLAALLIGALNLFVVIRKDKSWRAGLTWLAIAGFGLGSMILIGLARFRSTATLRVFSEQYVSVSSFFWIAFAVLAVMSIARLIRDRQPVGRLLTGLNVILLFVVPILSIAVSGTRLNATEDYWGRAFNLFPGAALKPEEQCVLDFRFTRETACLDLLQIRSDTYDDVDRLAAYKLTIFAEQKPILVLPDTYQTDDAVIVSTTHAWTNVHVRDWLLEGVPDDKLYNVVPRSQLDAMNEIDSPRKIGNIATLPDAIIPITDGGIWLIYTSDAEEETAGDLVKQLKEAGYARLSTKTLSTPIGLTVSEYRRATDEP